MPKSVSLRSTCPLILFSFTLLLTLPANGQSLRVKGLTCEYRDNPLGTDVTQPRLSWQLASGQRNVVQTAYEIRVGTDPAALAKGQNLTWHTGKVASDQSVHVAYAGPALQTGQRYYWQVRV